MSEYIYQRAVATLEDENAVLRTELAEARKTNAYIVCVTANGHGGCGEDHTDEAIDATTCWICKVKAEREAHAQTKAELETARRIGGNAVAQVSYVTMESADALGLPLQTPADTVQSVRELMDVAQRDKARADRAEAKVAEWEREEIDRASCCDYNEQGRKRAEAILRGLRDRAVAWAADKASSDDEAVDIVAAIIEETRHLTELERVDPGAVTFPGTVTITGKEADRG